MQSPRSGAGSARRPHARGRHSKIGWRHDRRARPPARPAGRTRRARRDRARRDTVELGLRLVEAAAHDERLDEVDDGAEARDARRRRAGQAFARRGLGGGQLAARRGGPSELPLSVGEERHVSSRRRHALALLGRVWASLSSSATMSQPSRSPTSTPATGACHHARPRRVGAERQPGAAARNDQAPGAAIQRQPSEACREPRGQPSVRVSSLEIVVVPGRLGEQHVERQTIVNALTTAQSSWARWSDGV